MPLSSDDFRCFRCKTPYSFQQRVGRRDTCAKCDADLHCCLNCRHYNPGAHNQCNESQAEWVGEKDRANYCDYFEPRRTSTGGEGQGKVKDARARFEDLFRK